MEVSGPRYVHCREAGAAPEADSDVYRLLSADAAAGVAIASTRWRNRDYAATVTGYLSVSYDPPTMLLSLYAESRLAEAVEASGSWALSLLGGRHQGAANWLASPGTPLQGLLNQIPYQRGPATGAAIIEGALSFFELRTVDVHRAATHLLVVGEVLAMGRDAEGAAAQDPLLHFASAYYRLGGRR